MILPQERQLGAAAKRGWMEALHVHFCGVLEERLGFVVSSRAEMAEVRSEIDDVVVVAPLDGDAEAELPWCFLCDCLERTFGMYSEMRLPCAEGGGRLEAPTMVMGNARHNGRGVMGPSTMGSCPRFWDWTSEAVCKLV